MKKMLSVLSRLSTNGIYPLIGFLILPILIKSQTILLDPNGNGGFENGNTFASNGWTAVNSTTDSWITGSAPLTSAGAGCAYVSSTPSSTQTWTYSQTSVIQHLYYDVTIPVGEPVVTMSFKWKANGEGSGATDWDNLKVFWGTTAAIGVPIANTPLLAANQVSGTGATSGMYKLSFASYGTSAISVSGIPGVTYRLVFSWKSDVSAIANPPAAIDEVSLTSAPPQIFTAQANGGLWSSPATWVGGIVPGSGNDIVIPSGSIVTVDQITSYRNLGVDGILQWNGTANTMTLSGNVIINPSGKFLPYTTLSGGTTGVPINVGGDFINNGYCNFSAGATTINYLNFNGSQQGASLNQTLGGTGVFEGNGVKGIIRGLAFQTTGTCTINTAQDLIVNAEIAHTNGTLNTNGKLTLDNTAQCFGQPINTQVSHVAVTNMGATLSAAPVVCGVAVVPYASGATAIANTRYFFGNNVYLCTAGGAFNATPPTSNTLNALFSTSGPSLLYIGTLGTLGTNIPYNSTLGIGTPYFYGDNWYQAIATTATTTMPTHVVGAVGNFLYLGPAAKVSVNFDAVTQTVRSLTITNAGSGWNSATAPALVFSHGVTGATGTLPTATPVVLYSPQGGTVVRLQKAGIAAITGGVTINSDQGASIASADPQASSGVGSIYTTNGGLNYTVAPQVGFTGPTALNLVTNQGSGYTAVPTVIVAGGTIASIGTTPAFAVTMAQGKVVSVYLTGGTQTYSVPPTISLSAGNATIAWPANCWPAATANIGSNRQITSFTLTNAGYGYVTPPTVGFGATTGTSAGGTFTTAAATPIARVALYNLTIGNFFPTTNLITQADVADVIPTTRKINILTLTTGGLGLSLANNLTCFGTTPLSFIASPNGIGNVLALNGYTLTTTWNTYVPSAFLSTFGANNAYLQNGSMALYTRGGGNFGSTYNFPFSATFTTMTGSGLGGPVTGSDFTRLVVTEIGSPSNLVSSGTGLSFGNRAFRLQGFTTSATPGVSGTDPTVTLRYNSQDGLTSTQDQTFVNQAASLTGAWNVVSAAYGVGGALPATGQLVTPTVAPVPVLLDGDDFFAWGTNAPTITNVSPLNICANSGQFTITGTNLNGITGVQIGGTPVASFTIVSSTQIDAVAGNGTSGVVTIIKSNTSFSSVQVITLNGSPAAPTVSPNVTVSLGSTTTLTATGTGGTLNWYTTLFGGVAIATGSSYTTPPSCATGSYYVSEGNGTCEGPRTQVTVTVTPITFASSVPNLCGNGGNITLTATPNDPSFNYTWTSDQASTTFTSQGAFSTAANLSQTSSIFLATTANGCTLNSTPVSIGVYGFPSITPTATPNVLCDSGMVALASGITPGNFNVQCINHGWRSTPANAFTLCNNGVKFTPPGGQADLSLDDGKWGGVPIGFNFNYFGTTFNTCNVGTNGVLNFGNYTTFNGAQFTFPSGFPNTNTPLNTIGVLATDFYFVVSGSVKYWTEGIAPNRIFVLEYLNGPGWQLDGLHSVQCHLFETTGIVEIHVAQATGTGTFAFQKTIGLQNGAGTIGAAAPVCGSSPLQFWNARSATIQPASPQGWRFNPPVNYTVNWTVNGVGTPSGGQLNGVTVNTASTNQMTYATTPYQVYIQDPITSCSQVYQTPVTVNASPTGPIATNSTQCGLGTPTASVASSAGAAGTGQYFWYSAAVNGNAIQFPPVGAYTTFFTDNFTGPNVAVGATLSGSANLLNNTGELQLFNNSNNQIGGITVAAGVNANSYFVDFDLITSTGADGVSYSFGDDVNAAATTPSQEMGSGSKLKISFDAFGATQPNAQGIYLLYNNTAGSFNNTSPGVLAYSNNTSWVNDTNHVTISIDNVGRLSMAVGATVIFNNVQLPPAYLAANKATWAHVISGRTGLTTMLATIDNLIIQYANNTTGYTTVQSPINTTTSYYVSEQGTNGCYSPVTPVTVTVVNPDPIVVTPGANANICIGQNFTLGASSIANPAYTYSWDVNNYLGSGINNPLPGAAQTITPTSPGSYIYTITGTNGVCTATSTVNLLVNALPIISSATANPANVCNNGTVNLNATSFIAGPQVLPPGYCATNNFGGGMINNVVFNTISNNTAATNPVALPYYTNTNLVTTVNTGQTYPLSITIAPGSAAIVSVWIDYNRDGVYAASEWQQVGVNIAANTTQTINVTIPANAQPGLTGMRIRSRLAFNTNGANDACTSMGSGETEDYQVNIQAAPANPYTYTWNTVPVATGASATTIATNGTGSNITVNYIVTAVDPTSGCVNSDTTNNITVYPAILPPTVINSAHCGVQVPTATANDVNGFVGPNYNWYATAVNTNALQGTAANTYNAFIGNTSTLYVAVEDTLTGCETSSTPVTITVAAGPALTLAALGDTICVGGSSTAIGLAVGAAVYNTYSWTPAAGVSGNEVTGWTFNPAVSTTYTLAASQSGAPNCSNQDTLSISVDQVIPPVPTVPQNLFNICSGTNSLLLAASSPVVVNTFTYTLNMIDSWGDGWNGNTMSVFVNGNPVLNNVTFNNGFNSALTFQVAAGDAVTAQFNGGGFDIQECTFNIVNNSNTIIFNGIPASAFGPPNMTTPYIVPGVPQPNYTVNWYNASLNGANIGTGSPLQGIGSSVMPTSTNGTYMFYAGLSLGTCNSITVPLTVNVADVVATVTASNTCIGQTNGTFAASNFICGTAPYTYSVNNGAFGAIPTNLAAGPHTVLIRDANLLLSSTYNINVGVDSIIPPAPIVPQAAYSACSGSNSIPVLANAPINQGSQTYTLNMIDSWGDGWNGNTISVLVNGVPVLVNATIITGYTSSQTFTVSGGNAVTTQWNGGGAFIGECTYTITNAAGVIIFSGTPASFQGPPNLNPAHIVPTPVQPNYVINWYNASTNGANVGTGSPFETVGTTVMPVANNGTYMFYAGLSLGACNSVTTVPVTVNVADVSGTITAVNATCNGVANGSFTATNFTCGTAPFVYSVNNGPFGAIPTNLPAGSHTVVIRDSNNLLSSLYNITITQPAWSINAPTVSPNGSACVNDLSEIVNASAIVNGQTQTVTNTYTLASNVYFAQNAGGTQSFTQNIAIPAGATVTGTVLSVNNVTTITGGWPADYDISLSGASTLATTTLANVIGQVTNAGPYNQNPTLISNNGGNVTVNLTNTFPFGTGFFGTIDLIVTYTLPANASNVTWWNSASGGNQVGSGFNLETVGTTVLPNTLTPGVYNFYAQGEDGGCNSATRTLITVTVNALPIVNAGNNAAICIGQSTTLAATGATTYTWNNGVTNGVSFTPNVTNTYTVIGVDGNGCINNDNVVVIVNSLPIVSAGANQTVCLNTPVVLSGSGATSYTWNNSVVNNTPFTPVTTNNYVVAGTDGNGCVNTDTATVTVLPLPIVTAGQDYAICNGFGATLTGTGASTYQWNNNVNNGVIFFPNTTQTYVVTGTGANGCSVQDSVVVTVNTTPSISLTNGGAACANGTVALSATTTNAYGGFWSATNGGGVLSPNVSNSNVVYNANLSDPSTVNFSYVAFNQCGSTTANTSISVLSLPTVNAGLNQTACTNSNVTLTATSNGTVVWNSGLLNGIAFAAAQGTTSYVATATGTNGCTNTDTVTVTGQALPDVGAGEDQTVCAGESVTLNGSGANSYAWSNNVVNGVPFTPTASGQYSVTGTGSNGCTNQDNMTVTVNALPNALVISADPVTLVASPPGATYQWINCATGQGITDANNDTLVATSNGSYAVIVTNANGCSDTSVCTIVDQVGIYFPESAFIGLYPNPTNGIITLELPADDGAIANVFDSQGKLIISVSNAKNGEQFDLSTLSTGVYTFRVTLNNLTHIEKVVKQ